MINLNTQQKLPGKAIAYLVTGNAIMGSILIIFGIYMLQTGTVSVATTVNGVPGHSTIPSLWPGIIAIALGIFLPICQWIWCSMFSFTVTELNITINSGIIVRKSKTIDFVRIQNVDVVSNPFQMIFGISRVDIWTASPNQSQVSTVMVGGVPRTRTINRPEGMLYLLKQDAQDIRAQLSNKGAIQNVNIASSNPLPPQ